MAGVPAGRLSIEIVAEIARLQQDLDKAKRMVRSASGDIAKSAKAANDNIRGMGNSSRLASHHMQNLSFQLQDIVIGLKGGQKPMTVFMQQGSQISQIMMQAGVGVGGLVKAIGSMAFNFARAHPILLAITAAAGAIAGAFGLMAGEINKNSKVTVTWGDVALGTFDAIRALLVDKLGPAFEWLSDIAGKAWAFIANAAKTAINFLIGSTVAGVNMIIAAWNTFPGALAEMFVNGVNLAIAAMERLINTGITGINRFVAMVNDAVGSNISTIGEVSLGRLEQNYAGAGAVAGRALAQAATGSFRDYVSEFVEYVSPFAQERARRRMEKDAEEAGKGAGRAAGKAAGKEAAQSFADAFSDLADYMKQVDAVGKINAGLRETLEGLQREAKAIGLSAKERKALIRALEYEAEIRPLLAELVVAELNGQESLASALREQIRLRKEILAQEIANDAGVAVWERTEEAVSRVNDQLRDMAWMLGGPLGGFMEGLLSGNFSGMGAGGQLLNILLTPQADLAKQVDVLAESLDKAFGIGGTFGKVLATGLQGAAIGSIAAQTVFGQGGTNAGASIGGALGQVAGAAIGKAVGGAIGSALGPIGAIAGSLLGNLVGGLFGGTSKGVIGITGSSSGFSTYGTKHGSAEQLAAATQAATGMFDALGNIARELGGTLNAGAAGRLSLGMRDDDWVLDPTGQGRTKGAGVINFGPDQEAAVKAAMKLLIDRGVIGGIRESTQRLLQNASDLEQGLQDALAFEGVFKALEAQANPFASALRQLGQEMEYLEGVFQRAGATAEEYAQLQEFIAMQQQALIDQASANYRSTFYTDAENVAFAKQTISSTLTPLGYGNVDTVAEYKALVEATDALADPELYGTLMELSDEFGVLKDAADQAKAAAAAEAAQKKAEAEARKNAFENELRAAWQRERGELERLADSYRNHAENLRDWRLELIAGSDATLGYQQRLAKLRDTFQMARLGDEKALQALPGAGNDFLSAARGQATSLVDYQRAVGMVARMAEDAARTADGMATDAEKQIALLDKQVGKLIDIDQGIKTVAELLGGSGGGNNRGIASRQQRQYERIQRMQERNPNSRGLDRMIERYEAKYGSIDTPLESGGGGDMTEVISSLNGRLERQQRTLDRMDQRWERMTANDGVGIIIRNDPDIPLNTVAA